MGKTIDTAFSDFRRHYSGRRLITAGAQEIVDSNPPGVLYLERNGKRNYYTPILDTEPPKYKLRLRVPLERKPRK